ncbi:MAG: hypothetical protein Q7T71_01160 [Herbiconiux sp.]|nr:hypothetical protein [Herbiconiux sp.]
MPFRTKEMLEEWVGEFAPGDGERVLIDVLRHDDGPDGDTGLVVVRLTRATTEVYLQPQAPGDPKWEVHFAPRDEHLVLDSSGLMELSSELARASALCEFLEQRSSEHLAAVGRAAS